MNYQKCWTDLSRLLLKMFCNIYVSQQNIAVAYHWQMAWITDHGNMTQEGHMKDREWSILALLFHVNGAQLSQHEEINLIVVNEQNCQNRQYNHHQLIPSTPFSCALCLYFEVAFKADLQLLEYVLLIAIVSRGNRRRKTCDGFVRQEPISRLCERNSNRGRGRKETGLPAKSF